MIYHAFGITWLTAQYAVYLFPCIVLAIILLVRRVVWQKKLAAVLGTVRNFSLSKKIIKTLLLSAGLIFLALALLRPSWEDAHEVVSQEGRDIIIALDISRSMLAQDMPPSRLEFAKKKIKDLVSRFKAERVCLMAFSGVPFIQCPFTTDVAAFLTFLDLIDVESISTGTTALDKALNKAVETFQEFPAKKHKIMVIFTDGEDFSPLSENTDEKIQNLGLSVFAVGVGTEQGAPIPLTDEQGKPAGHVKDEKGSIVITRLNEPLLKKIAAQTHAQYLRASADDSDIDQLVADIQHFEKEKFEDKMIATKQEKYFIFAALAFFCFLLEWII